MWGGQPTEPASTNSSLPAYLLNPLYVAPLVGDVALQERRTVLVRADCVGKTEKERDVLGPAASAALGDPSGAALELAGDALTETLRSAEEEFQPGLGL